MNLQTKAGQKINLGNQLGTGGEGNVYTITGNSKYRNAVAKIFHPDMRTAEKLQKVKFQIHNPPPTLQTSGYVICWPQELLFEQGQFVGFIMPKAFENSEQLYVMTLPTLRNLKQIWNDKYDRQLGLPSIVSRLKLCTNIASAIYAIHSLKVYTFIDMKPENILITVDGRVSIVDTDSFQIAQAGKLLFRGVVATPGYAPPENDHINRQNTIVEETWDRFTMAVVFYQILFGIHPYVSTFGGKYENSKTQEEHISDDLFVFGAKRQYVTFLPESHKVFAKIPPKLQNLFIQAFTSNPNIRPSAETWGQTFYMEIMGIEQVLHKKKANTNTHSTQTQRVRQQPPKTNPTSYQQNTQRSISPQPQQYQTPTNNTQAQTQSTSLQYAGFWERFGAYFIDSLIVGVVNFILSYLAVFIFRDALLNSYDPEGNAELLSFILGISLSWLYFASMESSENKATLGKMAVGIKVVDLQGNKIGFSKATGRFFGKIISAIILLIGFIMASFTEKKQALHDMMASTLVIRK